MIGPSPKCYAHPDVGVPFQGAPCWKCHQHTMFAEEERRDRRYLFLTLTFSLIVGGSLIVMGAISAYRTWKSINQGESTHGVQTRDW